MSDTPRKRVMLVDDHPIVRQGLTLLINSTDDLVVCAEASAAREALELVQSCAPDIAVVDISLEDRNGVELVKDLIARRPGLHCLALSMYDEAMYAVRFLRAGGRGYIMKQEVPKRIIAAIRKVLGGHVYLSETMSTRLVDQIVAGTGGAGGGGSIGGARPQPAGELNDRELEILTLIGRGQTTREIAENLFLSVKTVEGYRERIKEKLALRNGNELLRYAMQVTLNNNPGVTGVHGSGASESAGAPASNA